MNSENSKAYYLHSLVLNTTHKIDLRREARVASSNLSIYYIRKNIKYRTKAINPIYRN